MKTNCARARRRARTELRGTAYVEVLVIVAVVLGLGLLALTSLANATNTQAIREGECIRTLSCTAGSPSGGGGGSLVDVPTSGRGPAEPTLPPNPTKSGSVSAVDAETANSKFKAIYAQGSFGPDGAQGKVGLETLAVTGKNGNNGGLDLASAEARASSRDFKASAALAKGYVGTDVGKVPVKLIGVLLGGEVKGAFKFDKTGADVGVSAKADLVSVEGQVGKLDPTTSHDIRGSVKVGVGVGAKLKLAIKDEDGDGNPELHLSGGIGLGAAVEGTIAIEVPKSVAERIGKLGKYF